MLDKDTTDFAQELANAPDGNADDVGGIAKTVSDIFEPVHHKQQLLNDQPTIQNCVTVWWEPGAQAAIREQLRLLQVSREERELFVSAVKDQAGESVPWSDALDLNASLRPVATFNLDLLPSRIRAWVSDVAERIQCSIDFVSVVIITILSNLIGRQLGILPKANDDCSATT